MRRNFLNRTLGILISVLLFCAGIPAQGLFGARRMISSPAPTLKGQLSLRLGLGSDRPSLKDCFEPSIRQFRVPELTFSATPRSSVIAKQRTRVNGKYSSHRRKSQR